MEGQHKHALNSLAASLSINDVMHAEGSRILTGSRNSAQHRSKAQKTQTLPAIVFT